MSRKEEIARQMLAYYLKRPFQDSEPINSGQIEEIGGQIAFMSGAVIEWNHLVITSAGNLIKQIVATGNTKYMEQWASGQK